MIGKTQNMPSAYILARDKIEQAKAMLESEIWRDETVSRLATALIARLSELDKRVIENEECHSDDLNRDDWHRMIMDGISDNASLTEAPGLSRCSSRKA